MSTLKNKAAKLVAVALVLSLTHVHALADIASALTQSNQGRLTTRDNRTVTVNGNPAKTGDTYFSGQEIQTPAGVGATVQLGSLGRVDIAPDSILTITFEDGRIVVTLTKGCVILRPNSGVAGSVQVGGQTIPYDPNQGALDVCANDRPGGPPIVGTGAASAAGAGSAGAAAGGVAAAGGGGLFGLGTAGTAILLSGIGVGTLITIVAIKSDDCERGDNPSPNVPNPQC